MEQTPKNSPTKKPDAETSSRTVTDSTSKEAGVKPPPENVSLREFDQFKSQINKRVEDFKESTNERFRISERGVEEIKKRLEKIDNKITWIFLAGIFLYIVLKKLGLN